MVDPGLLLDMELRHFIGADAAKPNCPPAASHLHMDHRLPRYLALKAARQPARLGSKQLDSAGVHCGRYVSSTLLPI